MADPTPVPLNAKLQKDVVLICGSGGAAKAFEGHSSSVQFQPQGGGAVTWQGGTPAAKAQGSAPITWQCVITAVQDWADPNSFTNYQLANKGKDVPVAFRPHRDSTVTFYSTVSFTAPTIGGAIAGTAFNESTMTMACTEPTTTAPTT